MTGVEGVEAPIRARSRPVASRFIEAAIGDDVASPGGLRHRRAHPRRGARRRRRRRPGRRQLGDLPRHPGRRRPRQPGDHPGHPGRGVPDPDAAAAGRALAAHPDRSRSCCRSAPRWASRRCSSSTSSASPGSDPSFPLFAFVFLVALGIDYNIFLMTRVREETLHSRHARGLAGRAHLHRRRDHLGGAGAGGDVPGARHHPGGVPRRARRSRWRSASSSTRMIVRSVLVTALNLDLGGKIWWPSKLDRTSLEAPRSGDQELLDAR